VVPGVVGDTAVNPRADALRPAGGARAIGQIEHIARCALDQQLVPPGGDINLFSSVGTTKIRSN